MSDTETEEKKEKVAAISMEARSTKRPILNPEIEKELLESIIQFQNRDLWRRWGMDKLRQQGSAILLIGPHGTGKTTAAKWLASKINKGCRKLDASVIGGGEPGASERGIKEFYDDCRRRKNCTIFMDECDHLLMNRESISAEGRTWQTGSVEMLMTEMAIYPGFQICATNHAVALDPALDSRFLSIIKIGMPDFETRIRIWKNKIPKELPLRTETADIKKLARFKLNGRQIENVIVKSVDRAIMDKTKPKLSVFLYFCEVVANQHVAVTEEQE